MTIYIRILQLTQRHRQILAGTIIISPLCHPGREYTWLPEFEQAGAGMTN